MSMYHNRPHVEDIRAMKRNGEKISMLFVTTPEEAAAANAGIHMSIEGKFFDAEMREAAGDCLCRLVCLMAGGAVLKDAPLQPQRIICARHFIMRGSAVMPIIVRPLMTSKNPV